MSPRPSLPLLPFVLPRTGTPTLMPAPDEVRVESLDASSDVITVGASTVRPSAAYPLCRTPSGRIHSRSVRTLADRLWQGIAASARAGCLRAAVCSERARRARCSAW